jgi:hypothetical protein
MAWLTQTGKRYAYQSSLSGNAYLLKKYGVVPEKSNLRVVGLINSNNYFWYQGILSEIFCAGLSKISRSSNSNLVFANLSSGTVEHELGHTFGLEDQYRAKAFLESVEYLQRIPPNYYPGALQANFDFELFDAGILYSKYPKGTSEYPLCSDEPGRTNCPDASDWQIDCYGRKLQKTGQLEKRSVMGPVRENIDVGFDCYEKPEIQRQWACKEAGGCA